MQLGDIGNTRKMIIVVDVNKINYDDRYIRQWLNDENTHCT